MGLAPINPPEVMVLKPTPDEYSVTHCMTCHKKLKRRHLTLPEKEQARKKMIEYWGVEIVSAEQVICEYESCCGNCPNVIWECLVPERIKDSV